MALDPDIEAVLPNYEQRHEDGESWKDMARRVEDVGDKRLAAVLRQRAAGKEPSTGPDAQPKERTGNKAVTTEKG